MSAMSWPKKGYLARFDHWNTSEEVITPGKVHFDSPRKAETREKLRAEKGTRKSFSKMHESRWTFDVVHAQVFLFLVVGLIWPWAEDVFSAYLQEMNLKKAMAAV